jgi:hypothetical protein
MIRAFVVWSDVLILCGVVDAHDALHAGLYHARVCSFAPHTPVPVVNWRAPDREKLLVVLWKGPTTHAAGSDIAG